MKRKKTIDCGQATDPHRIFLHSRAVEPQQQNKHLWPSVNSSKESV